MSPNEKKELTEIVCQAKMVRVELKESIEDAKKFIAERSKE